MAKTTGVDPEGCIGEKDKPTEIRQEAKQRL